jgi:hypothetical protein
MAEFKIGRFKFAWSGAWQTNYTYIRDMVVQFNGKTYVCIVPHTSDDFNQDIVHYTPDGEFTPYWSLMINGNTWVGPWEPTTSYGTGNIVIFGGYVYLCNTPHTSNSTFSDDNWDIFGQFTVWKGNWAVSTLYGIGDIVKYGGMNYICSVTHTSASTIDIGLEANIASWAIFNKSVQYKGSWTAAYRYKLNDVVKVGSNLWISTGGHSSGSSFSETNWTLWLAGLEYNSVWDNVTTYDKNDTVRYGGYLYVNKTSNNIGNAPSIESANWTLLTTSYEIKDDWSTAVSYKIGAVVRYHGRVYSAIANSTAQNPVAFAISTTYTASGSLGTTLKVNSSAGITIGMNVIGAGFTRGQTVVSIIDNVTVQLNEEPDDAVVNAQPLTFSGVNYIFWKLIIPGINWTNRWISNTEYAVDDLVRWNQGVFRCISNHSSTILNSPNLDTSNALWVLYIQDDIYNGTNNPGEFLTRNNGVNVALPIGASTNVLKTVDSTPTWSNIFTTPNVFYVATNGEDLPTRGTTWDIPWKTVAYACQQVGLGTLNPTARALLLSNVEFLVTDTYQWMLFQKYNNYAPFSSSTVIDQTKTLRDARFIVAAFIYDISRGANSQTVAATFTFFSKEKNNAFVTAGVAANMPIFIEALSRLFTVINLVMSNTALPTNNNYQLINAVPAPITQTIFPNQLIETTAVSKLITLQTIISTALLNQDTSLVPSPNQGLAATIFVKSGTYSELLPITISANVTLMGEELRSTVVQPIDAINTLCTHTDDDQNLFTVGTTVHMADGTPIQFVSINPVGELSTILGGVTPGQTYYVIGNSITETSFAVSLTAGSVTRVTLTRNTGFMNVYGGNALNDMFYVRNGTSIRNMTLTGLLGTLTAQNQYLTRRPTGGSYVSLDPGAGPDDVSAWIFRKSPYVQNVTTFGTGVTGLKIDSTLHNGGNRSVVCNDFTQIISDGIGIWCYGGNALVEAVSVFSYYGYAGYMAENGGKIRATNGNSSYGTYGVISEGYDNSESPIIGTVNNRATQATASVVSSLGANSNILKIQYDHAGSNYNNPVTNLIKNSNNFLTNWNIDNFVSIAQNTISPSGLSDGWMLTTTSSAYDAGQVAQQISIPPSGKVFTNISGTNISGSGIGATFNVTVTSAEYVVSVNLPGSGYVVNNTISIPGNLVGGNAGTNDITITVQSLTGTGIQTVMLSGIIPSNTIVPYTLSIYCKKGNAAAISLYAFFLGSSTKGSQLTYNFNSNTATVSSEDGGGVVPTQYSVIPITNGWYRISFTVYDILALNTTLEFRIYPRSRAGGTTGYTYVYGAQVERASTASFYLETSTQRYCSYANYRITGAGTGVVVEGNEIRSNAVFQARIFDTGLGLGGSGYINSSNNAQGGTSTYITLAQSDVNVANNYVGMRLFVNSGTGAGQYGYIAAYDTVSKNAYVLKESITPLAITNTTSGTNLITLNSSADVTTLYVNQPIQFIPATFTTSITSVGQDQITVSVAIGGLINTLTVSSTAKLRVGMAITFTGTTFSNITPNFSYYIVSIIDTATINISTSNGGVVLGLVSAIGLMTLNYPNSTSYIIGPTTNMVVNYAIQYTGATMAGIKVGTTYYIQDVIDSTNFTMASSLVSIIANATSSIDNSLTIDTSVNLKPFTPIIFTGTTFGGIVVHTKYYIHKIPTVTSITLTSSLLLRTATATTEVSNLITVDSTAGFVVGNPIIFVGPAFGGITSEQIYYIQVVNDAVSFTISTTTSGAAYNLSSATGSLIVKTANGTVSLSTASGTMVGTSTSPKLTLSAASGSMVGTFSAPLFGGVTSGTIYYVKTINVGSPNTITITATSNGSTAVSVTTAVGLMQIGEVGWDHINAGTPIVTNFDSSSVYFIEPKITSSLPNFEIALSVAPFASAIGIAYGNNTFIAIQTSSQTAYASTNGEVWTNLTLPVVATWTDIAYGNTYWVIISSAGTGSGSTVLVSTTNGDSWKTAYLPSISTWSDLVYGNGTFVAITSSTANVAYSTDFGSTWVSGSGLSSTTWSDIAYGAGIFVAVATGGTTAAYSTTNGATWTVVVLPVSGNWSSIAFGNGRFVIVSSTSATPLYSFNGSTWYASPYAIASSILRYGDGVFVAVRESLSSYTSESGIIWSSKYPLPTAGIRTDMAFGYNSANAGKFICISANSYVSIISAGCCMQARAITKDGAISKLSIWEPGSNYINAPTIVVADPNNTNEVSITLRTGSGVLASPTFVNRGSGYNTSSTLISVVGNGYADDYQLGISLYCTNLTSLPAPGDNLTINGNSQTYKVASSTILNGTTAPNLSALLTVSPGFTITTSPNHGASFIIREKYSQVRLTNHDFLNIGYGNTYQSSYPGLPSETGLMPQNQTVETNNGRVFYSSTDQDGNFKVGELFAVEQATGIVTLSASQFGLQGLSQLKIGGVAVGASAVVIEQFSTDPTFLANSNSILPTQRAIKSYLTARLSQGGSNTFTGQLIAGTVVVGGANKIGSTLGEGNSGWLVKMTNKVNIQGQFGGVDGDLAALSFFIKSWKR